MASGLGIEIVRSRLRQLRSEIESKKKSTFNLKRLEMPRTVFGPLIPERNEAPTDTPCVQGPQLPCGIEQWIK